MPTKHASSEEKPVSETDSVEQIVVEAPKPKVKKEKKQKIISDLKPTEIEDLIVELGNQGLNASQIGVILRDQHNIPKAKLATGKTVTDILVGHGLQTEIPEDLLALIRRVVTLDKHLQQNKKDFSAKRGFQLTVSKIRRLVAYYHKKKKLPADWRYSIEKARLLVK